MGVAERRAREREQRRALFIDIAEDLIAHAGLEKTTIDEITRRAEFSKRTFYLYFENKNDVFAAVALRALDRLHAQLDIVLETPTQPVDTLGRIAWAYFRFFQEDRASFDCQQRFEEESYYFRKTSFGSGPHAQEYVSRVARRDRRIYNVIRRGMSTGEIHSGLTPEQLLLLLWGQTIGVLRILAAREPVLPTAYDTTANEMFGTFVEQLVGRLISSSGPNGATAERQST